MALVSFHLVTRETKDPYMAKTLTVAEVDAAMLEVTQLLERYQETRDPIDFGAALGALDVYRFRYSIRR